MSDIWNITLDDSSPVFNYLPYGDGAAGDGWATHYSISGFHQAGGDAPLGDSSHVTWNNKSSLSLLFCGSSVYLYGQANCTYDVFLDDIYYSQLPYGGVLVAFPSIAAGQHNITITPYANNSKSAFSFDKAIVTLGSISRDPGRGDIYDNRNSSIVYQGNWAQPTNNSTPSTTAPPSYHETKVGGSTASLGFKGEAVMITGALGREHWLYRVTLDGVSSIYNASSWWTINDTILYFQGGLDPTKPHSVTLTNEGNDSGLSTLSLNSITVFGSIPNPNSIANNNSDTGNSSRPALELTTIIGATVGGILGVMLIIVLVLVCQRRNRDRGRYNRVTPYPKDFGDDKKVGYTSEPFTLPPDSPISAKQPPIGYSVRSTKDWSMDQPNATPIGHVYWQDQWRPARLGLNPQRGDSLPSAVSETTEDPQDERASPTSGHGLLTEHIVPRLHLPAGGGGRGMYGYVPPGPGNR
ncbi:hypothetical protein FRC10_009949 [Ceratobasidium sp. 414]|nr:hypothetical protein FRC10_009949 [Ceratobasidium sp. 414]